MGGDAGFDQGHQPPQPCPSASATDSASAAAAHAARTAARADRIFGVLSVGVLWGIVSYPSSRAVPVPFGRVPFGRVPFGRVPFGRVPFGPVCPSLPCALFANLAFAPGVARASAYWGRPGAWLAHSGQRRGLSLRNYECAGLSGQLSAIAAPVAFLHHSSP